MSKRASDGSGEVKVPEKKQVRSADELKAKIDATRLKISKEAARLRQLEKKWKERASSDAVALDKWLRYLSVTDNADYVAITNKIGSLFDDGTIAKIDLNFRKEPCMVNQVKCDGDHCLEYFLHDGSEIRVRVCSVMVTVVENATLKKRMFSLPEGDERKALGPFELESNEVYLGEDAEEVTKLPNWALPALRMIQRRAWEPKDEQESFCSMEACGCECHTD